jgi:hypothetical protein
MTSDLNAFASPRTSHGDYGLNQPVGAWPSAGENIVVNCRIVGSRVVQIGYDLADPTIAWIRNRSLDAAAWSEWKELQGGDIPEPPGPTPKVDSLSPESGVAGQGKKITVIGSGFTAESKIWTAAIGAGETSDTERNTTFVSETELYFNASSIAVAEPGLLIWVKNADGQEATGIEWPVAAAPPPEPETT